MGHPTVDKVISTNRKARHDYHIEESCEAGIVLTGTEVKSVRNARVNLKDSFAKVEGNELFLYNMHISPYEQGNRFNHDPLRVRKLLMHKIEIGRLTGKIKEKGYALIPLKIYLTRGRVKVELGLGRGKKLYDKRRDIAEKDSKREMERVFRDKQRNE
jgi:SsrA-binding protein